MRRYFGTDGIRGRVGAGCLTPRFLQDLGFALAKNVMAQAEAGPVLLAHDTRLSADFLRTSIASGLLAAGCDVDFGGVLPTPVLAYLTEKYNYAAGVMLSASHNQYQDNGVKIFAADGFKLSDADEDTIASACDAGVGKVDADCIGALKPVDLADAYLENLHTQFKGLDLSGLHIVLDCANGAWHKLAPEFLTSCGATLTVIAADPDGRNINAGCGATAPQQMAETVQQHKADIGLAFDGDGDRLIVCDAAGKIHDGDAVLYILATQAAAKPQGVVGTLMTNLALQKALQAHGIEFVRAKVGDRYVLAQLRNHGWSLGGESSGHILSLQHSKTGDALLTAVLLLSVLSSNNASLAQALEGYSPCPQVMLNVKLSSAPRSTVDLSDANISKAIRDVEESLGASGRVLVRASGTEPVVRVMVEAEDGDLAATMAKRIADVLAQAV